MALYRAGEQYAKKNNIRDAMRVYQQSFEILKQRSQLNHPVVPILIGRLAELYLQQNKVKYAIRWLRQIKNQYPKMIAMQNGQFIEIDQWLDELQLYNASSLDYPLVKCPINQSSVIPGKLVSYMTDDLPDSLFFVWEENVLSCFNSRNCAKVWERKLISDTPVLVKKDETKLTIIDIEKGSYFAIESTTGNRVWGEVDLVGIFENDNDDVEHQVGNMHVDVDDVQGLQAKNGIKPRYVVVSSDEMTMINDYSNKIIGVNEATGVVDWQIQLPFDVISHVTVNDSLFVVTGKKYQQDDLLFAGVAVFDISTGQMVQHVYELNEEPEWVGIDECDIVYIVMMNRVIAYDLRQNSLLWQKDIVGGDMTSQCWLGSFKLLVMDDDGILHVMNAASGKTVKRVDLQTFGIPDVVKAEYVDDRWHLMTANGAVTLEKDGEIAWRDTIVMPGRKLLANQRFSSRFVVYLSAVVENERLGDRDISDFEEDDEVGFKYRLYLLKRSNGSLAYVYDLKAMKCPLHTEQMQVLEGGIVLTDGIKTYLFRHEPKDKKGKGLIRSMQ